MFLLEWNEEYLSQRIVAGPFEETDGQEILKRETIKQLKTHAYLSDKEAGLVFTRSLQGSNSYEEIDFSASEYGAFFRYGSGYEERLSLVIYPEEGGKI